MKGSYKFGKESISVRDLKWVLRHLSETGPQPYKDSAFVFEQEDDSGTVSKRKVRILESDVIKWMAKTLEELGSGYW